MHPPSSGVAIDSWLLILSFELKFFVGRHVSIHVRIPKSGLPVCLSIPWELKHTCLVKIILTVVNKLKSYMNGKVLARTTAWEPKNLIFFSKKEHVYNLEVYRMWDFQYSRIRMRILYFNIRGYRISMRILYFLLY